MTDDMHAQVERLQAEVAQQEATLAELDGEVIELERELTDFRQRYERVVGAVATRLSAVKEAVEELERRIYFDKMMGEERPMKSMWTPPSNYVPVEEQYRRAWEKKPDDDAPHVIKPKISDAGPAPRLKRLYRELARRYHPDFATNEADRERRNQLMAIINEAYANEDEAALQALADQPGYATVDVTLAEIRLRQLQHRNDDLSRKIAERKQERATLMHNDLMRLKLEDKLAQARGRDVLKEMADQLEQEYWTAMETLEKLRRS